MAKHNLFLGTGSGSVGDVVVMRREGVQVQRVRVRDIANPKSVGQAEQRNFLAPVAKFFAPLAGALEKGWEGLNKSKSYSAFLKKNIDMARSEGYWVEKGTPFFPLPYYLTMGTLPPIFVEVDAAQNIVLLDGLPWSDDSVADLSSAIASYAQDVQEGDQITLIAVVKNGDSYVPIWERFFIDFSNNAATSTILKQFKRPTTGAGEEAFGFEVAHPQDGLVACAVIHSRWSQGKWRRSPQRLVVDTDFMNSVRSADAQMAAIASYRDSANANASDVYLNGSTAANAQQIPAGAFVYPPDPGFEDYIIFTGVRKVGNYWCAVAADGTNYYMKNTDRHSAGYGGWFGPAGFYEQAPGDESTIEFIEIGSSDQAPFPSFNTWLIEHGISYANFMMGLVS